MLIQQSFQVAGVDGCKAGWFVAVVSAVEVSTAANTACVYKLQEFSDSIYEVIISFSIALTAQNEEDHLKDFTDQWVKSNEDFKEKIPKARKIIEEEFRRLLGVEEIEFQQDGRSQRR